MPDHRNNNQHGEQLKVYIAGPMSGYAEFNFPAFFAAAEILRRQGHTVFNPAAKDVEAGLDAAAYKTGDARQAVDNGFDFREAFAWDVTKVIEADAIYMLQGWEQSPGAQAEHSIAVAMQKHYPYYMIAYERDGDYEFE